MKILTNKRFEEILNNERKDTVYKMRIVLAQVKFEASEVLGEEKSLSKQSISRLERIIGLIRQNI